jgi:hypothetical protein
LEDKGNGLFSYINVKTRRISYINRRILIMKTHNCLLFILIVTFFFLLNPVAAEERYSIPLEGSPSVGPENAPLVIVEFLDYQ